MERANVSSSADPSRASVEGQHDQRPSSASSSTSTEDFIHRPRGRGVSESRLHGATSAVVTETGGGSSTNGRETPSTPRKRIRNPESWKNVAKAKRARGEEYMSPTTGKTIPAHKPGPSCKCRRKCYEMVSERERAIILKQFNGLANQEIQDAYFFGLISSTEVKRRRARTHTKIPRRAMHIYRVSI